jgi:site-specific recombinase XerD
MLRVSGIMHFHIEAELPAPASPSVRQVLKGAEYMAEPSRGKAALSVDQLRRIVEAAPATAGGLRDRAIFLLGFATGLRRSNLGALDVDDIEFRAQGLAVRVCHEKNNQTGPPRWIGIFPAAGSPLCPVEGLRAWLAARGDVAGPLFCQVLCRRPRPGVRLGGKTFAAIVKRAVALAGLDPRRYAAHSMRAGFVTAAAEAGVSPLVIMQTTGHRSMKTLQRYFRPACLFNVNPLSGVL